MEARGSLRSFPSIDRGQTCVHAAAMYMDTSNRIGEPVQVESAALVREKSMDEGHGFAGTVQVGRAVRLPRCGVRIGRCGRRRCGWHPTRVDGEMRTDSFQPSPCRLIAPGSMISMKCRVFCRIRRSPVLGPHPARGVERLGDQGGGILQGDHEECGNEQIRVLVEGAATGKHRIRIEPRGLVFQFLEELLQGSRRSREEFWCPAPCRPGSTGVPRRVRAEPVRRRLHRPPDRRRPYARRTVRSGPHRGHEPFRIRSDMPRGRSSLTTPQPISAHACVSVCHQRVLL